MLLVCSVLILAACHPPPTDPPVNTPIEDLIPMAPGASIPPPSGTCSDYGTQAEAQAAVEAGEVRLRDGDSDGIYCEALP